MFPLDNSIPVFAAVWVLAFARTQVGVMKAFSHSLFREDDE
jgi:hypothetical protein